MTIFKHIVNNLYFAMDTFQDLYVIYLNNNEDEYNQMSELEFFKSAFKGEMNQMEKLKQVCILISIFKKYNN